MTNNLGTKIRRFMGGAMFAGAVLASRAEAGASENVALFEGGQVRPLALSPSGNLLFAVNTPDARLEIFRVLPSASAIWILCRWAWSRWLLPHEMRMKSGSLIFCPTA